MSQSRASAPARGGSRAWAELLRAPLLLSPAADVLAGWCLGTACTELLGGDASALPGIFERAALSQAPSLALAAGAGTCLLAAGMAQNALADQADDAVRKPGRPLPRGALGVRAVAGAWAAFTLGGLALASRVSDTALAVSAAIIVLTASYHYVLKRSRIAGCLTLGTLRALDLLLGTCVATAWLVRPEGAPSLPHPVQFSPLVAGLFAGAYGLLMAGASLHASTDDEPDDRSTRVASLLGLNLHQLAFAALAMLLADLALVRLIDARDLSGAAMLAAGLALPTIGILRTWKGARTLPAGPLTGVLLSGLYLFDAAVCASHRSGRVGLACLALVLLLFAASRRMRRAFPPS